MMFCLIWKDKKIDQTQNKAVHMTKTMRRCNGNATVDQSSIRIPKVTTVLGFPAGRQKVFFFVTLAV